MGRSRQALSLPGQLTPTTGSNNIRTGLPRHARERWPEPPWPLPAIPNLVGQGSTDKSGNAWTGYPEKYLCKGSRDQGRQPGAGHPKEQDCCLDANGDDHPSGSNDRRRPNEGGTAWNTVMR